MKLLLSISSFKKLLFGIFFGLCVLVFFSYITNYIIKNSNHRLSRIYSFQKIESSIFFIGNSRAVPFNIQNLKSDKKIFNLSQNSMNAFQVENIIKAIKAKQKSNKKIYIELTSLADNVVQCHNSIFYDLKFFFEKKSIRNNCKRKFFFEKFIPVSKINNELFYRVLYYFFFPKEDQLWTNNYKMPETVCNNPKTSSIIQHFFSNSSELKIYDKSKHLLKLYADNNTKIFFFISPVYQNKNLALEMENKFLGMQFENLIKLNSLLNNNFFENCDMYADTIHLSANGVKTINKFKIFNDF